MRFKKKLLSWLMTASVLISPLANITEIVAQELDSTSTTSVEQQVEPTSEASQAEATEATQASASETTASQSKASETSQTKQSEEQEVQPEVTQDNAVIENDNAITIDNDSELVEADKLELGDFNKLVQVRATDDTKKVSEADGTKIEAIRVDFVGKEGKSLVREVKTPEFVFESDLMSFSKEIVENSENESNLGKTYDVQGALIEFHNDGIALPQIPDLGGRRFVKVDRDTGERLYGAIFRVYNEQGQYLTIDGKEEQLYKLNRELYSNLNNTDISYLDNFVQKLTDIKQDSMYNWTTNKDEALFFISDKQGQFEVKDIPYGKYYLKEIIPPRRYNRISKIIEFEIDNVSINGNEGDLDYFLENSQKSKGLEVSNEKNNEIPQSGTKITLDGYKKLSNANLADYKFIFNIEKDGKFFKEGNIQDGYSNFRIDQYSLGNGDKVGDTHYYKITEKNTDALGIVYDPVVYEVEVRILSFGGGGISMYPLLDIEILADGKLVEKVEFNNKYDPIVMPDTGEVQITKTVENETEAIKGKEYEFNIYIVSKGSKIIDTEFNYKSNLGRTGKVKHGDLLKIKNDEIITINNLPDGTRISILENVPKGFNLDSSKSVQVAQISAGNTLKMRLYNIYEPKGNLTIVGKKVLQGAELKDYNFTFNLYRDGKLIGETTNNGSAGFVLTDRYTRDDIGKTYIYTIKEVNDKQDNIVYDDTVYTIDVTITDNGEGKIIPKYERIVSTFTNKYEEEVPLPITGKFETVFMFVSAMTILPVGLWLLNKKRKTKEDELS